jgi:hypothetical protein
VCSDCGQQMNPTSDKRSYDKCPSVVIAAANVIKDDQFLRQLTTLTQRKTEEGDNDNN